MVIIIFLFQVLIMKRRSVSEPNTNLRILAVNNFNKVLSYDKYHI